MKDLKDWSEKDDILKNSKTYNELLENVDSSIVLLNELLKEPENCEKQAELKNHHMQIQQLFKTEGIENLRNDWLEKYIGFVLQMRDITRKSYNAFYKDINEQVTEFIAGLNEQEKIEEHEIVEWHKKFKSETEFIKKQILIIQFMSIFYDERVILEKTCKVEYRSGL